MCVCVYFGSRATTASSSTTTSRSVSAGLDKGLSQYVMYLWFATKMMDMSMVATMRTPDSKQAHTLVLWCEASQDGTTS